MGARGADLAVLTGVGVIGDHRRDAPGAGPLKGVQHQTELHQVAVDRGRTGGLNDEYVVPAHIVADFDTQFTVAERGGQRGRELTTQVVANGLGQIWIGRTCDDFQVAEHEAALLYAFTGNERVLPWKCPLIHVDALKGEAAPAADNASDAWKRGRKGPPGPVNANGVAAVVCAVWLGWKGSNLRMTEPKPVALPLGYIPVFPRGSR